MSSQDKLEKVLRDIHVLISRSEVHSKDRIIVNKQEMFGLIDRLNTSIYEIMEEYELTKQSRDKAEREHKKQGDKIIWDASRKAEDIYAASVMYTDEALNHVQAIMEESTEQIRELQNAMLRDLEEKKQIVRANQLELKAQLQDLVDTEKYLSLIEERNKEIEREKRKNNRRFDQPKEKGQFEDVKTEIRINREYFRNAGIELEEASAEEVSAEKKPETQRLESERAESEKPESGEAASQTAAEAAGQVQEPAQSENPVADAASGPEPMEKEEVQIDLSGVTWDVDGLDEAKPQEPEAPKRSRLHFFRH